MAAEQEYDLSFYLSRFKVMFGEVEGLRLTALALQPVEPDISLLFWLRYTIGHLASGLVDQIELAALLSLVADMIDEFQNDGTYAQLVENDEYSKGLGSLVRKLYDEVHRHLPGLEQPLQALFDAPNPPTDTYGWLQMLIHLRLSTAHAEKPQQAETEAGAALGPAPAPGPAPAAPAGGAAGTSAGSNRDPAKPQGTPQQLELF